MFFLYGMFFLNISCFLFVFSLCRLCLFQDLYENLLVQQIQHSCRQIKFCLSIYLLIFAVQTKFLLQGNNHSYNFAKYCLYVVPFRVAECALYKTEYNGMFDNCFFKLRMGVIIAFCNCVNVSFISLVLQTRGAFIILHYTYSIAAQLLMLPVDLP